MTCKVVSAKVTTGTRKDGSIYHWCSVWVVLDDGSMYEVRCKDDYQPGDMIELAVGTRFGRLDLRPLSEVTI